MSTNDRAAQLMGELRATLDAAAQAVEAGRWSEASRKMRTVGRLAKEAERVCDPAERTLAMMRDCPQCAAHFGW